MKYFVWISGLRGPEPQIWDEKDKTQEGKPVKVLMKPVRVGDDISLSQACLLYPWNEIK